MFSPGGMNKQNLMKTTLKTPLGLAMIEGDAQGVSRISITDETPSKKLSVIKITPKTKAGTMTSLK